jgi:hypothetical protein
MQRIATTLPMPVPVAAGALAWSWTQAVFPSRARVGYAVPAVAVEKDEAKAASENEAALAALYQKYAPAIYAHCRRFMQSPAAARDATQEAPPTYA